MGNDWIGGQLGDFVQIGSSKRIFYKEYVPEGVPFYRSKEVIEKSSRKNVSTELYILHNRFKEIKEKFGVPQKGDILLTSVGTLGVPWVVDTDEDFYFKDGNLTWFKDFHPRLNNHFLFYWLVSPIGKNELEMSSIGSTQPALTIKGLKELSISIPPIEEQIAIIGVLSALDDKIDLLQRQNRTLESLAQALFRHWLIDGAGADWEECSLYDAIELVGGGTPKTSEAEYWGGDIYWLSGGDIANNHKNFVVSSDKTITELGLQKSATKLLPQFSTVISARGTVGKYCLLAEPMAFSQTSYGVKPKFEHCFFFTYLLIDHSVTELLSAAYGSVFDTITIRTFQNQRICVPSEAEILSFEDQITPYFQRMKLNQIQIRTLASLRDTLLPKLMSGEVRVRG